MDFVVIKFGGTQHVVSVGDKIEVNGNLGEVGKEIEISEVLLTPDKIGTPVVSGVKVMAKIVKSGKGEKIDVMKFKAKSRYRRKTGFRALVTVLEITAIK